MDTQILLYFTQTTMYIHNFIFLHCNFFQVSNGNHFLKALPVFEILYLKINVNYQCLAEKRPFR